MSRQILTCLLCCFFIAQDQQPLQERARDASVKDSADLHTRIEASPELPFKGVPVAAHSPTTGWASAAVSGVAIDSQGTIYEIQRGDKADPVLVLDQQGSVIRSWGKGEYTIPHSIRLDPEGNVWTVDAASSKVIKYSPIGKKLMTIAVGGQPDNGAPFNGTTDIAFASKGRIFITDGYANARVLEYTPDGKRLTQWGKSGSGPGEFHLPHSIQIDENGIIYVADRQNGRIQEFDRDGHFRGQIAHLGLVYSIKLAGSVIWASMGPRDQPPGSPGWLLKLDRKTGRILGHLNILEQRGGHAIDVTPSGEPVITLGNELLWFKSK